MAHPLPSEPEPDGPPAAGGAPLRLYRWHDPPIVGAALIALAAGFGQFGAVAALGDVAKTFGHLSHGASFADQAGLSGTTLGVGLAVLRLASLGGLPLAGLADRLGRRRVMLATCAVGLAFTVAAAASPGYWWFVAIFALGRAPLSGSSAVAQVDAVELTASSQRARAVALIAAGYALGAGVTAVIHSLAKATLGFRGIFALAVVPLVSLWWIRGLVVEPDRFSRLDPGSAESRPVLGPVGRPYRRRLLLVAALAFAVSVVTGPANSMVFIYAQNVLHMTGLTTSLMVVGAGATGLVGLLVGRRLADHLGRRPTVALAMAGMVAAGSLAYQGGSGVLIAGYALGAFSGALFAPAGGALANELFPTAVRASVAGWNVAAGVLGAVAGLLVFGAVADASGGVDHAGTAALVTFLPVLPVAALLLLLPETAGHEPEELWGEPA